eukprot:TRINITY_DN5336_c0_g1_i1.p1 TRINITY_DN5336_c0_g1~~TRINITY_DN5336_c0_g1_i1.p1  ORF type:complete len:345 (+),score=133.34 TRINITY_DN5336_c0_g1_i1:296-1330(+)
MVGHPAESSSSGRDHGKVRPPVPPGSPSPRSRSRVGQHELVTEWGLLVFGLLDSINISFFLKCIMGRQKIRKTYGWCCCLNLLVAVGSVAVQKWSVSLLHLYYAYTDPNYTGVDDAGKAAQYWLMTMTHDLLWKFPLFFVSYPLNSVWLCEIFDEAYKEMYSRDSREGANTYDAFLDKMTDALMQAMLLIIVCIQTVLLRHTASLILYVAALPFGYGDLGWWVGACIGVPFGLMYDAWLYSFYAFGSRLDQQKDITLKRKIQYFHTRWMYFLGYGLPPAALLYYIAERDTFLSSVIYFVLLPLHAVLSVPAQPEKQQQYSALPFFQYSGVALQALIPTFFQLRS